MFGCLVVWLHAGNNVVGEKAGRVWVTLPQGPGSEPNVSSVTEPFGA